MKSWFLTAAATVAALVLVGLSDAGLWVWRALVATGLVADADCPGRFVDGGIVQPMCAAPRGVLLVGVVTFIAAGLMVAFATRRVTRRHT